MDLIYKENLLKMFCVEPFFAKSADLYYLISTTVLLKSLDSPTLK